MINNNIDNTYLYIPLELQKLCCNTIIKQIYHSNYIDFKKNLFELNLPSIFNDLIIDRYIIVNHILSVESKNYM